jgi:ATP-binding cassette subfamily A (ABC1) protein 3
LYWADDTDGTSNPSPAAIIARITSNFTTNQLASVKKLSSASDFPAACPQNFNFFSQCFAAIGFNDIPASGNQSVNYTISADSGLAFIDVVHHTSDFEKRILPLQWSIDKVSGVDRSHGILPDENLLL